MASSLASISKAISEQYSFEANKAADTDEANPNAGDGAADAWADYQMPVDATHSVDGTAAHSARASIVPDSVRLIVNLRTRRFPQTPG